MHYHLIRIYIYIYGCDDTKQHNYLNFYRPIIILESKVCIGM